MIKCFQVGLLVLLSCICFENAVTIYFKKKQQKSVLEQIDNIGDKKLAKRTKNIPRRTKRKAFGRKKRAQNKNRTLLLLWLNSKLLGIYWICQWAPSFKNFLVRTIKHSVPHLRQCFSHQHQSHTDRKNSHIIICKEEEKAQSTSLLATFPTRTSNTNQSNRSNRLSLILRGVTILHYSGASNGKPSFNTKVKQKIANFYNQTYELPLKGTMCLKILVSNGGAFKPFFPICCVLIGFTLLLQNS